MSSAFNPTPMNQRSAVGFLNRHPRHGRSGSSCWGLTALLKGRTTDFSTFRVTGPTLLTASLPALILTLVTKSLTETGTDRMCVLLYLWSGWCLSQFGWWLRDAPVWERPTHNLVPVGCPSHPPVEHSIMSPHQCRVHQGENVLKWSETGRYYLKLPKNNRFSVENISKMYTLNCPTEHDPVLWHVPNLAEFILQCWWRAASKHFTVLFTLAVSCTRDE
jgi:hypothetical protein